MDLELLKNTLPDLHQAKVSKHSLEEIEKEKIFKKYSTYYDIFNVNFSEYNFRPHAIHNLMGGIPKPLTIRQEKTLQAYQEKIDNNLKITDKQYIDYGELLNKKNAKPILNETAKRYLDTLFKERVFHRTKELTNKYLSKGIIYEKESIDLVNLLFNIDIKKNNKRFSNEYFTGEPDIIYQKHVFDIKTSWDFSTFPLLDNEVKNKAYFYQLQAYMDLLNFKKSKLIYVLVNTPKNLIEDEKRKICYQMGLIDNELNFDLPKDLEFEIERNLTYSDLDEINPMLRVKIFDVKREDKVIKQMHQMVILAREYLSNKYLELSNFIKNDII